MLTVYFLKNRNAFEEKWFQEHLFLLMKRYKRSRDCLSRMSQALNIIGTEKPGTCDN